MLHEFNRHDTTNAPVHSPRRTTANSVVRSPAASNLLRQHESPQVELQLGGGSGVWLSQARAITCDNKQHPITNGGEGGGVIAIITKAMAETIVHSRKLNIYYKPISMHLHYLKIYCSTSQEFMARRPDISTKSRQLWICCSRWPVPNHATGPYTDKTVG